MAGHKLTDNQIDEAMRLVAEHGSIGVAARMSQTAYTTMARHYKAGIDRDDQDPAIKDAMAAVGTGLVPAVTWAKTKSDGTTTFSVLLKPKQADAVDIAAYMREAFEGFQSSAPVIAPAQVMQDLCTIYPLMDVHFGMQAWGRETGGPDYDINLACQDMRHAFSKICAITPNSTKGILIIGGDFFHANDNTAETQASRHKLDVDSRHRKILDAGVEIIAETIERLLQKHQTVVVRVLRGNHDPESHLILTYAMIARYRLEPRIEIENSPRDLFMHQWGACAIFAHHGDKFKPQQAALYVSDACSFWSATRHRHFFTGHIHHDSAKDFGPIRCESLRAFCPPDAYASSMGYGARRALQSITFHLIDGLVLRAIDPIDRPAMEFQRSA